MSFLSDVFSGELRLRRERAREQLAIMEETRPAREAAAREYAMRMQLFAGARPGIDRKHPRRLSGLEDYTNAAERIVLIKCARQLEEDDGFFDGLLNDFQTYVIGDALTYMPNTGNPEADKVIREYLEGQFDNCDYSGREDLTKMAQLAVREMKRDGEMGFVPVDVDDAIKLHMVAGDCIGDPYKAVNSEPYNFGGIVVDENSGRPLRFQLYRRVPKREAYELDQEVPADQFFHYRDRFRIQQYHGFSVFKNSIRDGFDLDQILEYTKLNIKYRSSQLPTVQTPGGQIKESAIRTYGYGTEGTAVTQGGDGTAAPRGVTVDIDGVSSRYLDTADKIVEYPNDFPNAQLKVTVEEFRRQCCRGCDLPYEFVYAAGSGGVIQRFWVDKAKNTFDKDKHLAKRSFLNPYKNRCIDKGIQTGELDLRRFGILYDSIERFRGSWQMGKEVSADYGKDNQTDIALCEVGLMSKRDKAASMNTDIDKINDETDAQNRKIFDMAKKLAADYGINIREALPFYDKKFPNQAATQGQQEKPAAPVEE